MSMPVRYEHGTSFSKMTAISSAETGGEKAVQLTVLHHVRETSNIIEGCCELCEGLEWEVVVRGVSLVEVIGNASEQRGDTVLTRPGLALTL